MLTHFSLFSGIGGIDLASEWAGFKTVGQCEFADYPTKVLEKHWPDVPRWRDIRSVTADSFREKTGLQTVDLISGGFPCQPFSVAGKQKGEKDDRYLWPEMLRVIRELTPTWVVCENVPGILRIAGRTVCEDLERAGYAVTVLNFEAAAVGATHRRERVFFVANANSKRLQGGAEARDTNSKGENANKQFTRCSKLVCDTTSEGFQNRATLQMGKPQSLTESKRPDWWAVEPNVGRVANGVPDRVDRLKCLGNAVVPQQVYPILQAIANALKKGW